MNIADDASSIVQVLKQRAQATPDRDAFIFLEDGENRESRITYAELDRRARRLAAELQGRHADIRQQRLLLVYPQGIDFIVAFFGTLYAGAIAVLVYPPTSQKMGKRLNGIINDCSISLLLSTNKVIDRMVRMELFADESEQAIGQLRIPYSACLNTETIDFESSLAFEEQDIRAEEIAFLQYTSGSTGTPKGVIVSHANLMANERSIDAVYQLEEGTVVVGWLPLIHDMGLIGNVVHPLFVGATLVFMSPLHFVQNPLRWLRAISKYRASTSGGPNFAYELCNRKIDDADLADLDLSCWKIAFNGAEPVRAHTIRRFAEKFGRCGLPAQAQMAVYGLAEATLLVTGTEKSTVLDTDAGAEYMSSGHTVRSDIVKIVDPETGVEVTGDGRGEIWVNGPSVAQGYWNKEAETEETFRATVVGDDRLYMRTGDIGFLADGELHVTGRIKDVIIVQGRNYHAEDMEWTLSDIDGLRPGCCAAFSLLTDERELLAVVAGATTKCEKELARLTVEIRSAIYEDYQLHIDRIALIPPRELPMTTSGKVQRQLTRERFRNDQFTVLYADNIDRGADGDTNAGKGEFVAAGTPQERELTRIWSDVLGAPADEIGIHDNFFDLGGSSLTMLELATRLDVAVELLFRYPTINGYLYRNSEYEFPDVHGDIHLPPAAIDDSLRGKTGISLITGGTGFFGLHFLQSMMKRTDDRFVLLIRGSDEQAIQNKLDAATAQFNMQSDIDQSRLILMRGDLSEKHVGIPDDQYGWVCENVDKIFHIGSHVNNWLPYEGIREINVDGTRSLIELARTGRKKEFHYTSTSTFTPDKADPSVFMEQDDIDLEDINRYFGYDISKYASESMCKMARAEGLVCNIYRLVWVGGHIDTGITKINDGFNIMLRMLLTIKAFPKGNYLHDIVPVDLMADSMASLQGKGENVDYNVTSQSRESIDLKRIAVMLRDKGYEIDELSRTEFVERLRSYPIEKWDEYCRSYRQLVIRLFEETTPKIESFYDSSNFRRHMDQDVLARMEERFIDDWFEKTVNFLVQNNALPTASGSLYDGEMEQIAGWNATQRRIPADARLHKLFECQAARTPDAVALRFENAQVSYRALDARSNEIAASLLSRNVEPGSLVGLCVDRSPTLIAAILGIFKAGCAYVPLDPSYPRDNLDFMIDDCGTEHIVIDTVSQHALEHRGDSLILIDQDQPGEFEPWHEIEADAVDAATTANDLAYVIYTSGTTGNPKGVMVEHGSAVNHARDMIDHFGLRQPDSLLQFSTVNFDSFNEEVFPTLFSGATLVLTRKDELTDVGRLQALITARQVSVLKFSTAYWQTISDLDVEQLGVRLVAVGGEEVDAGRYRVWRKNNPFIPLVNTYGPTETTVTASVATIYGDQEKLTIGKPVANTSLYVLDESMRQVPIGFVGELYIGGKGVSRGYLNRPELNREVFMDDPFVEGHRMYKTGDLGRWSASGDIEFLGRIDNQVKVRGYRIELGAIESVLGELDAIEQAVVVIKQVDTLKKIVAYVVPKGGAELDVHALREDLEGRLPGFMLPNLIIRIDEIPSNPNGKVDRKVLADMEISKIGNYDFCAPATAEELAMVAIWEKLLGVGGIGLNDNFMELGGHSLLVMSLINDINLEFDTRISVNDIYEHNTVGKLVNAIADSASERVPSNLIEFPAHPGSKNETNKTRPLFMVHGLGGHLASFYPLVNNLKEQLLRDHQMDITVYGLEANGFEDGQECFEDIGSMVERYVALIRERQPHGPYLLGGWSYGVSVAHHIAQELLDSGEEVEVFISIDAEAPKIPEDFERFLEDNRVGGLNDLYADGTLSSLLGNFGKRFGFAHNDEECAKEQFYRFLGYSAGDNEDQVERLCKVAISNLFNARGFRPSRIRPTNTLLVRASSSRFDNYESDWFELLDGKLVSTLTLSGDHWSIMQEPELASHVANMVASSHRGNALRTSA